MLEIKNSNQKEQLAMLNIHKYFETLPENYMNIGIIIGINAIFLKSEAYDNFLQELFNLTKSETPHLQSKEKNKQKTILLEIIKEYFSTYNLETSQKKNNTPKHNISPKVKKAIAQLEEELIKVRNNWIRNNIEALPIIKQQIIEKSIDTLSPNLKSNDIWIIELLKSFNIITINNLLSIQKETIEIIFYSNKNREYNRDQIELIKTLNKIVDFIIRKIGLKFTYIVEEDINELKKYIDDCDIWNLGFSAYTSSVLYNFDTLSDIVKLTEEELLNIPRMNTKIKKEIETVMRKFGYKVIDGKFVKETTNLRYQKSLRFNKKHN